MRYRSSSPFTVTVVKDASGERIPFLIDSDSGLPVPDANRWRLLRRRGKCQSSTLKKELLEVSYLYRWARGAKVDLADRVTRGIGILLNESTSLIEYLKQDFASSRGKNVEAEHVSLAVQQQRFSTIRGYLCWWMDTSLERAVATEGISDAKYVRIKDQRDRMMRWLEPPPGSTRSRLGLTPLLRQRFIQVIHPESLENPWSPRVRLRNYVMFSTYFWLGLRLSELLAMKCHHADLSIKVPTLLVERMPDDPEDPRLDAPQAKTLGRQVPVPGSILKYLKLYIKGERPSIGHAKRHGFLFVSSQSGAPLSKRAVQHALKQLILRHPEFRGALTVHVLRHCWSDMLHQHFGHLVKEGQLDSEFAKLLFNYLGGWGHGSVQHARYSEAEIRRAADAALLRIHEEMFSIKHGD
jgi:integrase